MSKDFFNFLKPTRITEVVDIGANPIDGLPHYYKMLKEEKLCNLTGFEPQEEALKKLIANSSSNERYLAYAIGNGSNQVFHICEAEGMSSHLRPNIHLLEHFGLFKKFGRSKINEAVCIQTEVSFMQLYENQPTFSDIDYELRNIGFIPHCFASVKMDDHSISCQ